MSEVVTTIDQLADNAFTITVEDWRGEKQVTLKVHRRMVRADKKLDEPC